MEGMEDKLGAILGNPQLMQQIMSMANSLSQGNTGSQKPPEPTQQNMAMPDAKLLQQLSGMAGSAGMDANQKALLNALCPYLSRQRISKLEKAMRAAKIAKIATTFLDKGGLSLLTGR